MLTSLHHARTRIARAATHAAVALALALAGAFVGSPALAAPTGHGGHGKQPVDQSLLVPTTLDSVFAPFLGSLAALAPEEDVRVVRSHPGATHTSSSGGSKARTEDPRAGSEY